MRLSIRALEAETAQQAFELGYPFADALEVVTGERKESHRSARNHGCRPLSREKERDLAERVACAESLGRLATLGHDIGLSVLDEVDRGSVVVEGDDRGARIELDLAHRTGELVELRRRKIGEERKCCNASRIHGRRIVP